MIYRILSVLIVIFFNSIICVGKKPNYDIYNTDNGLPNNSIMTLYQDERGFIWIGTRNGISLYGNNSFKTYKYQKGNPNSPLSNNTRCITGNGNGEVYIATYAGVSSFDIRYNKFKTITTLGSDVIFYHKKLYIAIDNTIYVYNDNRLNEFIKLEGKSTKISALDVYEDKLVIGTNGHGVYIANMNNIDHVISKGNITRIFRDSKNRYWIGTWEDGLYLIDKNNIINHKHSEKFINSLSSNFVRQCYEDNCGNIWIGTLKGLDIYNEKTNTFTHKIKSNKESENISVWSMICDKQGNMWIGTYYNGLYKYFVKKNTYKIYSSENSNNLSSSNIMCFVEDNNKHLWIGTNGGGLNCLDLLTGKIDIYQHSKITNSISDNNINTIYYDSIRNCLWIGTYMGGLNKLNLKTRIFTNYNLTSSKYTLPTNNIRCIKKFNKDILISTHKGIYIFNPEKETFEPLFKTLSTNVASTNDIIIDYKNNIWIPNYGVYKYNTKDKNIDYYNHKKENKNSISSNNINKIFEDSQKRLWFCNNLNGIDLYRHNSKDFVNFDKEKNNLLSNCVYNVCELSNNKLLFLTDEGISILNTETMTFSNYKLSNFLPINTINETALFIDSSDNIYIGSINGLISFKENDLNKTRNDYKIYPYRFFINGKESGIYGNDSILKEDVTYISNVILDSNVSTFSIEYINTDFSSQNNIPLKYYLEGFSNSWTEIYGQPIVTFTNLNPGNYKLKVCPADNKTNINESCINITILPPFYRTNFAYFVYSILLCLFFYFSLRSYNKRIKMKQAIIYEKKRAEDIEELNQNKLRFFTNISHEFRTPLTLIIGDIEMLLQKAEFNSNIYKKILNIYRNSILMKELISELLDFRKQEQGYLKIKVKEHNIVNFIYKSYQLFQEYAKQKNIRFTFQKTNDNINVWFDEKQMQKVINNLLSNAFRHTKEGGYISILVRKEIEKVIIEITDNGDGIPTDELDNIFNRFYQSKNNKLTDTGTGIGLALTKGIVELHHGMIKVSSIPNEETTFSIILNIGNESFSNEEIDTDSEYIINNDNFIFNKQNIEKEIEDKYPIDNEVRKSNILIVEDNESLRNMLKQIFEDIYNVYTAKDGENGWKKIKETNFELVISDIVMPNMTGIELCRMIKNDIDTCHIPVVLLTAHATLEKQLEGLSIGADDYINKPFSTSILLMRCRNLINSRKLLQEKFSKQIQINPQELATNAIDKKFIDNIMTIIEQHIEDSDFNIDILSSELGIARTKLFSKIKAITGETPYNFILTVKLKKAAYMLKNNPELNISEISYKLGFSSPRQFSKFFKDKYHIAPSKFIECN